MKNTLKNGAYRWMIFKEENTWYGVALEFGIVVDGEDPRLVEIELQEAVLGYLESAKKLTKGFREDQINSLLNLTPEPEYEDKWAEAQSTITQPRKESIPSPLSDIYKVGIASLANV